MTTAVFDSNVLVSGAGWRTEAHLCLVCLARRRLRVFTSARIIEETRRTVTRLQQQGIIVAHDPWPILHWFASAARLVTPTPTGKPRSRDPADDPVLGTALAARVRFLVTLDKDLLALGKPFGVEILRPAQLLARLQRPI